MRLVPDATWAILTLWGEGRGESYEGKRAIAEVIRNRMARRYSSDGTVPGTVLYSFQFSTWNTNDTNRQHAARLDDTDPVVQECARAWLESGEGNGLVKDAVLYYNPALVPKRPSWAEPEKRVAIIGAHHFFRG